MSERQFDPVSLEIMWSRLIGIADDMWTTVLRTAVSTIIGAAQDFGCEILDAQGSSVAHSNRSMPSFNVVMPIVVRATMERFPADQMRPGDVFITNDPWICAGHLDDVATITPIFDRERLVGFASSIAHATSIGGSLSTRTVRDLYEEGLKIPVSRMYETGRPNPTVFSFIESNVRTPELVLTDLQAQLTANELGARRVIEFLQEYQLPDLTDIARAIQSHSERAMRQSIVAVPDGAYESEVYADGLDQSIRICCRVTVAGDTIDIDFNGTDSEQPRGGLNSTMTYTLAHTLFPMKCLLSPTVPANEGTYRPITVLAPEGSVLNCRPPASVRARPRTGWHIHTALFRALADTLPDRVQAGNGLMHSFNVYGQQPDGNFYNAHFMASGGRGASLGRDGIGRNGYPSSARNVPIELFEARTPVLVRERALRPNSAGLGRWRGAYGQRLVFSTLPAQRGPVSFFIDPDRLRFPPQGIAGGGDGPLTEIVLNSRQLTEDELSSGQITLRAPEDRLEMRIPGGGGYGAVEERDPQAFEEDRNASLSQPGPSPAR